MVHASFAMVLLSVIVLFRVINDRAVIDKLFTIAGYTYGPLLGLYAFGLFTKWNVRGQMGTPGGIDITSHLYFLAAIPGFSSMDTSSDSNY